MAIDKYELIKKYVKSRLGAPILSLCENEELAIDESVEIASTEYWNSLPYTKIGELKISSQSGEFVIDVESLKNNLFSDDDIKEAIYFLGIVRQDFSDDYINNFNYDTYLLKKQYTNQLFRMSEDPRYYSDQVNLYNANHDNTFGSIDFRYDDIEGKIYVIAPWIDGKLILWYGWGFDAINTIKYLPMRYFDLFKKMVCYHLLETIIAARTSVVLKTDYELKTDDLEKKRDTLKEEINKEMKSHSIMPILWS